MDKQTDSSGRETYTELRIVLVGYNESGKSSTGNTILGSDEFDLKKHAECVKKEGVVAGRQICVIDTPGRHRTKNTPKLYQEEVVRSVTLCPPGPHALLLNVNVNTEFVELYKKAVMEHLNLFGETVWKYIIVLFTHGDQLEDKDIQQYIECEGEPLQWVLDKCGNRFHIFNNKAKKDSTQVAELLKKIDAMVAVNHGSHFELDKEIHYLVAQKQRKFEEIKKYKQQQCSKDTRRMGNEHMLKKQRIVLLGQESAGKTSTADTILNSQESDLKPTLLSTRREAEKWQVTVVDTPGWLTNDPQRQMPKRLRLEIVRSVALCPPGPHAFLLVIPANKTFTEANETAINDHLELLGKNVWNHTIVLLTHADWMGDSPIELYIDSEGEPLNRILEKCGNRYHTISNIEVDQGQVEALLEKIEVMVAKNGDRFYEMDSQKDMADEGCGDEHEDDTYTTFQLPSDPQEVIGQRERKPQSISTITPSSGYETTTLSGCDSNPGNRPRF